MREWLYYENFFNKQVCEGLISEIQNLPTMEGEVGTAEGFKITSGRKSKIRFIMADDQKYSWIFRDLWQAAELANKHFNYDIDALNFIQIAEYDGSYAGEYREHCDVVWSADKHRKLSCTVQLTEKSHYFGGDFHFYRLQGNSPTPEEQAKINKQGTIIFFNSLTYHGILPVDKGIRYSLTAWFEGPKWR